MMRKKIRVYLDTSVISALFDDRNPERQDLTKRFFDEIDYHLRWNFRHIVRVKTWRIVDMVNLSLGYPDLKIATPAELI
jgi:predicted nucleic acid-binding protein